ncbi:MAG: serine hydrolase, partial [Bacteroidota bacterium]
RQANPLAPAENTLNSTGYALLRSDRLDDALAVFKLNVREHPRAWNVYDSLGEANAAAGMIEEAKLNYRKSIELNPDNQNGKDWLEKLTEENK